MLRTNAYKGNRNGEYVSAEILWLRLVITHCNIFVVWDQEVEILSPLTVDGMNGIDCCPSKSVTKREPGHSSGSTLWQWILTVAYSILTCRNCSGRKGVQTSQWNLKFLCVFRSEFLNYGYAMKNLRQSLYSTASLFKTDIIWNERENLREKRCPHILILEEERI